MAAGSILLAFVLALKGRLTADFATICSIANGAFAAADTLITRKHLETK